MLIPPTVLAVPDCRMLRVALDGQPLLGRRTGIGNFTYWLLDGLARAGLRPDVYAVTWRMRPELEKRLPAGSRLIGRPMPARAVRAIWAAGADVPLEWFTGRLDVVHGTNYVVPPTRRAAAVVSVHDLTPVRFPELGDPATLAFPELIRRAVARGAWVHTASDFIAAEIVDVFGAEPDRVRTIPYGVPPLPEPGEVPPGLPERYVLAVGTVEPRKDYPSLVKAFDILASERPDLGLVIVGGEGWGADEFRATLEAAQHRDRVTRLGYVDDAGLAAVLHGAAVLAYPSRYEGFGFPPLQAMAAGVPVVATAAGAVPEVLGDAAGLVPVGDVEALAGALALVLDEKEAAAPAVRAGRARAEHFTWSRCASGMARLYEEAAAQRT